VRTPRAELTQPLVHAIDFCSIGERSDAHAMQQFAATVFRYDERVHEAFGPEAGDQLDRFVAVREPARLGE
jgi:hypothetical protein